MIKITNVEIVDTSTGKQYKKVTTAEGVVLSCWPDFIYYDKVVEGAEVDGVIKDTGKYKNLVSGNLGARPPSLRTNISAQVEKAQQRREESINRTLDRQEMGYLLGATFRDATLLATTRMSAEVSITREAMAGEWLYWKNWLLKNHPTEQDYSEAEAGRLIPS